MFKAVPFSSIGMSEARASDGCHTLTKLSHATEFFINLLGLFFKKVFFPLHVARTWTTNWGPPSALAAFFAVSEHTHTNAWY